MRVRLRGNEISHYQGCANDDFAGPVIRYKQRLLLKDVLTVL
jgi:hypothetical protein